MAKNKEKKIVRYQYVFFASFHDAMKELEDEQYGRIMRAINEFALYGDEPAALKSVEERMAWVLIRPILEKGRNKARTPQIPNQPQSYRKPTANQSQIVANPSLDISNELDVEMEKDVDSGSSCGDDDYYTKFVEWYNDQVKYTKIPQISVMSDERKKLFDEIRNKYGSQKISEVVAKAIRSDYLSGYKDGAPRMTIDWLLQEKNFIKAMEGVYNDD